MLPSFSEVPMQPNLVMSSGSMVILLPEVPVKPALVLSSGSMEPPISMVSIQPHLVLSFGSMVPPVPEVPMHPHKGFPGHSSASELCREWFQAFSEKTGWHILPCSEPCFFADMAFGLSEFVI